MLSMGVRGRGCNGGCGCASYRGNIGYGAVEPGSEGGVLDSPGERSC